MNKRLNYLDALRGIAVLLVLMVHANELTTGGAAFAPVLSNFIESGRYGVQLFFLISAFTIFYTLHHGDRNARNFLIRRFFRIAPLYYIAVCYYSWQSGVPVEGSVLNLLFLHGFSIPYINSVVPGGWSVGIEMLFYLLVPVLFLYINSLKKAIQFLTLTIIFSFIAMYGVKYIGLDKSSAGASFTYFWLPNQIPLFAIGFVLFFLITEGTSVNKLELTKACFPLLVTILIYLLTGLPLYRTHIIAGFAFSGLIYYLSLFSNKIFVNRGTLFLGKISYSMYLSQYALLHLMQKYNWYLSASASSWKNATCFFINFIILLVLTIAVSYLLYQAIEKPFQTVGRSFIRRKLPKAAPVTKRVLEEAVN